jgi:hypothetical protein
MANTEIPPPPTTTNAAATEANTVINTVMEGVEKVVETSVETEIETAAPIFAVPVIKQIEEFTINELVQYLGNKASIALQQVGTFVIIDTQVTAESKAASTALANLLAAYKTGNQATITAAIQAFANANSALDHDNGSATPST